MEDPAAPCQDRRSALEATQVFGELEGRGIPVTRRLLQAFQADGLQVSRHAGAEASGRDDLGADDLLQRLDRGTAQKRRPPGERLVEDRAQRIDVSGRPNGL
jgi:hypothetical protein